MKAIELLKEQQEFIDNLESKGKSLNTLKNYKTDLNCFNKYVKENKPELKITELSATEAQDYSRFLIQKYSSPNSIRRRVQALRIFFDYLIEKNQIDHNPIKKVIVAPKVVEAPKPASFENAFQLFQFLSKKIDETKNLESLLYKRNKFIFMLIYSCGLKVSDLAVLKRSSLLKSEKGYRVLICHPKKDPYTIALPQNSSLFIEQYLSQLDEQKNKDKQEFDSIFFNSNPYMILAGGLSPRGIEILFKDFSTKLKFKMTAKSLRQACIMKWIKEDKAHSSIKEWMGVQPNYSLTPYLKHVEEFNPHYPEFDYDGHA